MEYRLEDMRFLNMPTTDVYVKNAIYRDGKYKVFEIENQLTLKEKIEFIDKMKDGLATYFINIIEKWEKEKDTLSKDKYDNIRTVSKKAWLRKNDEKDLIDKTYDIGKYYFLKNKYMKLTLDCPKTEYGYSLLYDGEHIANQWFHDLCVELKDNERRYFESIDSKSIKLKKLKEYVDTYGIFDSMVLNDIKWNGKKDIEEKDIDMYIKYFEKIEKVYNELKIGLENEEISRGLK